LPGSPLAVQLAQLGMPEIDRLTDDAAGEPDTSKRLDMESQALEIAGENVLFVLLYQQPMAWATRSDVTHTNRPKC
jgi:ABC-type transport system substrate-binding protein